MPDEFAVPADGRVVHAHHLSMDDIIDTNPPVDVNAALVNVAYVSYLAGWSDRMIRGWLWRHNIRHAIALTSGSSMPTVVARWGDITSALGIRQQGATQ